MAVTSLSETEIESAVGELARAALTRVPGVLAVGRDGSFSIDDGYRIQRAWTTARVVGGVRRTGWKVGATSPTVQAALGIRTPIFGPLFSDMELISGAVCPRSALIAPSYEAEVAFRIGRALRGAEPTVREVLAATSGLAPALEVVDSRLSEESASVEHVVADLSRAARYVLGDWVDPRQVGSTADLTVTVHDGDRGVASGEGHRVLGDPAQAVAWLVGALADHGLGLEPGDIVMSGTLIVAQKAHGGEQILAHFDVPLGAVTLEFT
jgi:2-keto-4-pentenoate hydratase